MTLGFIAAHFRGLLLRRQWRLQSDLGYFGEREGGIHAENIDQQPG